MVRHLRNTVWWRCLTAAKATKTEQGSSSLSLFHRCSALITHHFFFFFFILWIYDIQEQTLNLIKENSKRQRNTTRVYIKKSLPLFVGVFDGCNCERCVPLGSFHLMIPRPDGLLLSPAGSVTVHLISAGSHYWSCPSAQAEDEVMRMLPTPLLPHHGWSPTSNDIFFFFF